MKKVAKKRGRPKKVSKKKTGAKWKKHKRINKTLRVSEIYAKKLRVLSSKTSKTQSALLNEALSNYLD